MSEIVAIQMTLKDMNQHSRRPLIMTLLFTFVSRKSVIQFQHRILLERSLRELRARKRSEYKMSQDFVTQQPFDQSRRLTTTM